MALIRGERASSRNCSAVTLATNATRRIDRVRRFAQHLPQRRTGLLYGSLTRFLLRRASRIQPPTLAPTSRRSARPGPELPECRENLTTNMSEPPWLPAPGKSVEFVAPVT